ncbi:MAG TPA: RDD family protein [Terriglobales bacterium]|nr:RDD family protein [Terriglobales bacterium]
MIPPAQHLLEESGIILPASPTAPPTAVRTIVRNPTSFRAARLGDRFIAFVLDTMVLFGLLAIVDAWVFMRWGRVEGTALSLTSASLLIAGILNTLILFAYGWLLEASVGATLGKAIVGIRVVRTGVRTALAASAIRNGLRVVDGLGFYLIGAVVAGCSRLHQRLGDICAGTAVVEGEFGPGIKLLTLALWIGTLAGAGWAVPRICSENAAQMPAYLNQVVVQVGSSESAAYLRVAGFRIDLRRTTASATARHM